MLDLWGIFGEVYPLTVEGMARLVSDIPWYVQNFIEVGYHYAGADVDVATAFVAGFVESVGGAW